MKNLFVISTLIFVFNAMASEGVFKSLDVEAHPLPAPRTHLVYAKNIGGLDCIYSNSIFTGDEYYCELDEEEVDHKAIFEALNVERVESEGETYASIIYTKTVDNLVCTMEDSAFDGLLYECILNSLN